LTATCSSLPVSVAIDASDEGALTDSDTMPVAVFPASCETAVYNGHRYFSCQISTDWNSARGFCSARASDLVVLSDQFEVNFMMGQFTTTQRWIGMADQLGEACFGWVDGSTPPDMGPASTQTRPGG